MYQSTTTILAEATNDNYRTFIHNFVLESLELFPFIRNVKYLTDGGSILVFYFIDLFRTSFPYNYPEDVDMFRHTLKNTSLLGNEAALSTWFRRILYHEATLSLVVDNGASVFLASQNHSYLMFINFPNDEFSYLFNITEEEEFPVVSEYQKFVWKKDDYETLASEILRLNLVHVAIK